jgi:glyoxylase-like metal-dependent hydrolase (beta-lactamase superfamily II)
VPSPWSVDVLLVGTGYSSTCTLITNDEHRVVVDTGLSVQEDDLVDALARHHLTPADVDIVINTHLHVDHCGNNSVFPRASIFASKAEWEWTHAFYEALFNTRTPEKAAPEFYPELAAHGLKTRTIRNTARMARLFWHPERLGVEARRRWLEAAKLPAGLNVLPTPGHTPHHLSIRVEAPEPVIIAGDAVLAEDADAKVKTMIPFSRAQFAATRQGLLDRGETIVPGHGRLFQPRPAHIF